MTPTTLLVPVNARLGVTLTAETAHLYFLRALTEISLLGPWRVLWTSEDIALVADDASKSAVGDIWSLAAVTVANTSGSWAELSMTTLAECLKADLAGDTGMPESYCRSGGTIYLDPPANGAYTLTLYYWRKHPTPAYSGTTALAILFGDEFFEAVVNGTIWAYLVDQGQGESSKAQQAKAEFDRQMALLLPSRDMPARTVRYPSE